MSDKNHISGREQILARIREDLIGPFDEDEELSSRPGDVYLTGILWPPKTLISPEEDEQLAFSGGEDEEGSDGGSSGEEAKSPLGVARPSTIGLSFAVKTSEGVPSVHITVRFGIYSREMSSEEEKDTNKRKGSGTLVWKRRQINYEITSLELNEGYSAPVSIPVDSTGLVIRLYRRVIKIEDGIFLATLTIANESVYEYSAGRDYAESLTIFQTGFQVKNNRMTQLIPRPSRRLDYDSIEDEEELSAGLLYRNYKEYGVGHTCSATWDQNQAVVTSISTTWIPETGVPAVSPGGHPVFGKIIEEKSSGPLSASHLGDFKNNNLCRELRDLPAAYSEWINIQRNKVKDLDDSLKVPATRNLEKCEQIRDRIEEGIANIEKDPVMLESFRLANLAMNIQYGWAQRDKSELKKQGLLWRPFQLGFILLSITSVASKKHPDRNVMDLLWFPTGGGKTEAYLGLVAFLAFYRRLSSGKEPDRGAGVAAIMRYTLRLLTTQQFERATSMIMACELIRLGKRREYPQGFGKLGQIPISIGLWVGNEATPGKFTAAVDALTKALGGPSPRQITHCPACGKLLEWKPDINTKSIIVRCLEKGCELSDGISSLPIYTVDEEIYRKPPTLLIGTIDKFAQITRKTEVNYLFGIHEKNPPDLIIQDELHLISGPLGTIAGLYEIAIDRMFSSGGFPPKIIGSTATIRRADDQVKALFYRETCQFPSSAIDADDSGFAYKDTSRPDRRYIAITTAGRSAKFTLQAVAATLLQSGKGSSFSKKSEINTYWTLVSYFNSLRELGGALVLMQDDVNDSIGLYARRRKEEVRDIKSIEELTSRRSQVEIKDMLNILKLNPDQAGSVDAVLATNMLSVGVDIPRLGLMLVHGQPKSISEYIQATSRVGRGEEPGLIIVVLNNAKNRDRSHFESFTSWHATLYRDVEATSVTPFASRARDRALGTVLVTLVRHLVDGMLEKPVLSDSSIEMSKDIIEYITTRASEIDPEEKRVKKELIKLLEDWETRSPKYYWAPGVHKKHSLLQDAETVAALKAVKVSCGQAWPAMNNMRSVEPSVRYAMVNKLRRFEDD